MGPNIIISKFTKNHNHNSQGGCFLRPIQNIYNFSTSHHLKIGLAVLPTAIVSGSPIYCTQCQDGLLLCPKNSTEAKSNFFDWWVPQYCTEACANEFVRYFPYILLGLALILLKIEFVSQKIFNAQLDLEAFYRLIVNNSIIGM